MKCPFCGEIDNKVIDSRLSKDGNVIRRRRECIICSRRFTTYEHIEDMDELERDLRETGEKEIPSHKIGEKIMAKLHDIDDVAYVRFASVYREFKDVNDFVSELKHLLSRH
ncbi:MAG: transcriptional regulator NrdR [Deltaproteobacteria bacterium]|nr:transcriptional regulator NrdR [Deltaproteobacteria bacterium]